MRIALFQPDQPGNVGSVLRLGACLGVAVDIIEPCGFAFSDRALKRSAMDYRDLAEFARHRDWNAFEREAGERIVLLTTKGETSLPDARFEPNDIILLGSESSGVPQDVHERASLRVRIPQVPQSRSLNMAVAAGIALAEALRQVNGWPR